MFTTIHSFSLTLLVQNDLDCFLVLPYNPDALTCCSCIDRGFFSLTLGKIQPIGTFRSVTAPLLEQCPDIPAQVVSSKAADDPTNSRRYVALTTYIRFPSATPLFPPLRTYAPLTIATTEVRNRPSFHPIRSQGAKADVVGRIFPPQHSNAVLPDVPAR